MTFKNLMSSIIKPFIVTHHSQKQSNKEYLMSQYRKKAGEHYESRLAQLSSLCFFLKNTTGKSLLDIGARDGYLVEIAKGLEIEAVGIELLRLHVNHAQSKGRNIIEARAESLPFNNKSFDLIFCRHTLEHVQYVEKCVYEINRVLKIGGYVYIAVPSEIIPIGKHVNAFPNVKTLKKIFKGFKIVISGSTNNYNIIAEPNEIFLIAQKVGKV